MERLGRLEVAALEYFRRTKVAADLSRSEVRGGRIVLRDAAGNTLVEIVDGISCEVSSTMRGAVAFAVVPVFRIELRCWWCGRRFLRPSAEYVGGEIVQCPACASGNVLPKDPLAASKE